MWISWESRYLGVISADGDQKLDVVVSEELEVEMMLEVVISRLETAHHQIGTAAVVDVVGQEEVDVDMAGVLAEKALVALMQADDPVPLCQESLGDSSYYCVDSGSRTTSC